MKLATLALSFLLALVAAGSTLAADETAGQCPGYNDPANTKVDTIDGTIVLEAGLTVCIHAGNGNTGTFVTDGTSTLADYIEASGLLNEGGQVPNVSNYVVYPTTPSAPPSEEPSSPPSEEPSSPPSTPPSEEPSAPPSEEPSSAPPSVTPPTAEPTPPEATLPPTSTVTSAEANNQSPILFGIVVLALALGLLFLTPRFKRS